MVCVDVRSMFQTCTQVSGTQALHLSKPYLQLAIRLNRSSNPLAPIAQCFRGLHMYALTVAIRAQAQMPATPIGPTALHQLPHATALTLLADREI
jgi:hypothetical protein